MGWKLAPLLPNKTGAGAAGGCVGAAAGRAPSRCVAPSPSAVAVTNGLPACVSRSPSLLHTHPPWRSTPAKRCEQEASTSWWHLISLPLGATMERSENSSLPKNWPTPESSSLAMSMKHATSCGAKTEGGPMQHTQGSPLVPEHTHWEPWETRARARAHRAGRQGPRCTRGASCGVPHTTAFPCRPYFWRLSRRTPWCAHLVIGGGIGRPGALLGRHERGGCLSAASYARGRRHQRAPERADGHPHASATMRAVLMSRLHRGPVVSGRGVGVGQARQGRGGVRACKSVF